MVLKIRHCRISPNKQIEEEVKLQSYIISFLFVCFFYFFYLFIYFFTEKQYMKRPMKVSIKGLQMRSKMSITFTCIFSREDHL